MINTGHKLLARDKSCLIVVDAQSGFCERLDASQRPIMIENIAFIVTLASYFNIPVIVTVESPDIFGNTEPHIASCLPSETPILNKSVFGLAGQADILASVRELNRDMAVIVGMETDVCIAQSAMGLAEAGVSPYVVDDACGAPGPYHQRGLERLQDAGMPTVTARGVFYEWVRDVPTLRQVREALSDKLPPHLK